ncbi:MAG: hypothetical protein GYA14_06280 [Ignavibacteria bacterium]|nr:hypothetical protein [Ignavibacteria bacterium]
MENLLQTIQAEINEIAKRFQKNTFDYFYEEDIRSELYCLLKNKIKHEYQFGISEINFKDLRNNLKSNTIISSIVKTEYPRNKRFDIAILKEKGEDFYNVPIQLAIEIKLGSKETKTDNFGKYSDDIRKLLSNKNEINNDNFTGLAIYFYQTNIDNNYEKVSRWIGGEIKFNKVDNIVIEANKVNAIVIARDAIYSSSLSKIIYD